MEVIILCCAGLDVHKNGVEACMRRMNRDGKLHQETRHWGTMTRELMAMADWLSEAGVTHVAMESTGVFWKPIFNILENRFQVLLVNARSLKHVPGRKTDQKDSQWIAQLLQHGLLQGSFIPPREQRELRDLTRHRSQVIGEHSRITNRIQKVLEDANIKLSSVATDITGASGRQMLQAIIAGEDNPEKLADLAKHSLRSKIPQLQQALYGKITDHHRWLLRLLYDQLTSAEAFLSKLDERIEQLTRPQQPLVEKLDRIPGIDRRVAEVVLAEVGPDMTPFPDAPHLTSWAGICPGNNESAGKRKSGKTTKGSHLIRRRGKKRGLVAVAHSLLIVIYHMLKEGTDYVDLGAKFLDQIRSEHLVRFHLHRLEELGLKVTAIPMAA